MRGTLPLPNAKDQSFSLASYRDFLAVCSFVAIGFTMCVGLSLAFLASPDFITVIAQLGG